MLAQEDIDIKKHYFFNLDGPLCLSKLFDALLFHLEVNLEDEKFFDRRKYNADVTFLGLFNKEISSSMYLFTDGSCVEDSQYAGFAVMSYDRSISKGCRRADFVSSYCVEAILMALD